MLISPEASDPMAFAVSMGWRIGCTRFSTRLTALLGVFFSASIGTSDHASGGFAANCAHGPGAGAALGAAKLSHGPLTVNETRQLPAG